MADSFQDSDLLDFYDEARDGNFVLSVQIRNCAGMCKDDVETVVRRGAQALIVRGISSSTLFRFRRSGVQVYRAEEGPAGESLRSLRTKDLAPAAPSKKKTE